MPRQAPTSTGSMSGRRSLSRVASARAGIRCPPVPPPAIRTTGRRVAGGASWGSGRASVVASDVIRERKDERYHRPGFPRIRPTLMSRPTLTSDTTRLERPWLTKGSVSPVVGMRLRVTAMCMRAVTPTITVSPTAR